MMRIKKSWFKISNLLNGLFLVFLVMVAFNPSAKALMIQGLMKAGLFQPDIKAVANKTDAAMPDMSLQDTKGQTIRLSDLRGKVLFINFWATWCPPCVAEMPSINGLYEKLKNNKNIVFITVDVDHNFKKSVPFMSKQRFNLPLYQATSPIPENFVSNSIPVTVIMDKQGHILFRHEGSGDYSNPKVFAYLDKLSR